MCMFSWVVFLLVFLCKLALLPHKNKFVLRFFYASQPFMWRCRAPSVCSAVSPLNVLCQSGHIFNTCCETPGALQSHFQSFTLQICKREHVVLLHRIQVNPHFPRVSKIIQLIRLPSLISCLWDHKNQNFIGGWFPQALPCLLSQPVSLYLVVSLLSSRSPFSSPSSVVITVPINTEHQFKKKKKNKNKGSLPLILSRSSPG